MSIVSLNLSITEMERLNTSWSEGFRTQYGISYDIEIKGSEVMDQLEFPSHPDIVWIVKEKVIIFRVDFQPKKIKYLFKRYYGSI